MEVVNCLFCFIFVASLPAYYCTTYITSMSGMITNGQLVVSNGSSLSLRCTVNKGEDGSDGNAFWRDPSEQDITYNVDVVHPDFNKYGIVKSQSPDGDHTQYTLDIRHVNLMDEGHYTCLNTKQVPPETTVVTIYVSFPPISFKITQKDINVTTLTLLEGESSDIVCTSIGSRPEIDIWWYHRKNGGEFKRITDGVSQNVTTNPDNNNPTRYDTVSTLRFITSKDFNGGELKCAVTGLGKTEILEAIVSLNVQYAPIVNIQYENNQIRCSSDANPVVQEPTGYLIVVNNTDVHTPTCADGVCALDVDVMYETVVRCNATNVVNMGTAMIHVQDASSGSRVSISEAVIHFTLFFIMVNAHRY